MAKNNTIYGGLLFHRDTVGHAWGTTLDLTPMSGIETRDSLFLSFEISLWDIKPYGYVFAMTGDKGNELLLTYSPHLNKDSSFLALSINGSPTGLGIPLPKRELRRGKWDHVEFRLDFRNNTIQALLNQRPEAVVSMHQLPGDSYHILFGYSAKRNEVPIMAIRNITIQIDQKDARRYPLNELDGEEAHDVESGLDAVQSQGEWLARRHLVWTLERVIQVTEMGVPAFDPVESRLFFVGRNGMLEYSLQSNDTIAVSFATPVLGPCRQVVYDDSRKRLLSYYCGGGGELGLYDFSQRMWSMVDTLADDEGQLYGLAGYVNPVDKAFYSFGGYGWYKAKNCLLKYVEESASWDTVHLSGEKIEPRTNAQVSPGIRDGELFLSGGEGNNSGKQEDGFVRFNDLWLVQLHEKTIQKLWSASLLPHPFLAGLVKPESSSVLYGMFRREQAGGALQLYSMAIDTPMFTPMGDSLLEPNQYALMPGVLWFDSYNRQLISLHRSADSSGIRYEVRTLFYPPLPAIKLAALNVERKQDGAPLVYYAVGLFLVVSGVGYWYMRRRNSAAPIQNTMPSVVFPPYNPDTLLHSARSRISVFGRFSVHDSEGNDIAPLFTPRLRQLFLMLLLDQRRGKSRGITSEEINSALWPDADAIRAKNSRGVAMKELRDLLNKVDNISIVHKGRRYSLDIPSTIECDYHGYLGLQLSFQNGEPEQSHVRAFITLVSSGDFLDGESYEWLDPIRAEVSDQIIAALEKLVNAASTPEAIAGISEVLLRWDPVNEPGLRSRIKALAALGRHREVKLTFEKFIADHESMLGTPFPYPLQTILDA